MGDLLLRGGEGKGGERKGPTSKGDGREGREERGDGKGEGNSSPKSR